MHATGSGATSMHGTNTATSTLDGSDTSTGLALTTSESESTVTGTTTSSTGGDPEDTGSSVDLPVFTQLAAGGRHTCGLSIDGEVRCWGSNDHGQLGDGTTQARLLPTDISLWATALSTGESHTCALARGGALWCWGSNHFGQVGAGSHLGNTTWLSPIIVNAPMTAAIVAGAFNTCLVSDSQAIYCWGDNEAGQLGAASEQDQDLPSLLAEVAAATTVSIGMLHACALRPDGSPICWGSNNSYELGHTLPGGHLEDPVGVPPMAQISAGGSISCATTAAGEVWCWGGLFGGAKLAEPFVADASEVRVGLMHACARMKDGRVMCWGSNHYGQLGDGTTIDADAPQLVPGLTDVIALTAGYLHTCALRTNGTALCWGRNEGGQLGDGTTTDRSSPVPVGAQGTHSVPPDEQPDGHTPGVGFVPAPGTISIFNCGGNSTCNHVLDTTADPSKAPFATADSWEPFGLETILAFRKRYGSRGQTPQGHWAELFPVNRESLENAFVAGNLGSPANYDGKPTLLEQMDSAYTIPRHSKWHCDHWVAHLEGGSPDNPIAVSDPNKPAGPYSEPCVVWKLCTCYYDNIP